MADLVDQILTGDPNAKVIVLGDLNEFSFLTPLAELTGGVSPALTNLEQMLDPTDRYTFVFDGNIQALDHILVTDSLLSGVEFDAVHINSGVFGASDHDPLLASFLIPVPEPTTSTLALAALCLAMSRRRAF